MFAPLSTVHRAIACGVISSLCQRDQSGHRSIDDALHMNVASIDVRA
jgi:hypothetical protein